MVSVYIDTIFIDQFQVRSDRVSNEVLFDFEKLFLKKVRGVDVFVSDSMDAKSFKEKIEQNEFYNDLAEIGPINFDDSWCKKLNDSQFLNSGNTTKLFLLGNDIDCNSLIAKHNILFINNYNLIEAWDMVRINREVSEMTPSKEKENPYCFTSWKDLENFKHPFNKMLLLDFYLLTDKTDQRISNNITPMLNVLSSFVRDFNFDLTIVAEEIFKEKSPKNIIKVYEELNRKNTKIIFYSDNRNVPNLIKEHDREIITNYLMFVCPSGWNIFKDKKGINHRTTIQVKSIFKNDVRNTVTKAIENLKKYYESVRNESLTVPIPGHFEDESKTKMKTLKFPFCYPQDISATFLES